MWEPGEKKKDNKQKNDSTDPFKYTTKMKSPQINVDKVTTEQKKKNKKLSLEVVTPKPRDPTEKMVERLIAKNGSKYLVKWINLPEDENTWEQKSTIPKHFLKVKKICIAFILFLLFQYYERDLSRLGSLPPKLKSDLF